MGKFLLIKRQNIGIVHSTVSDVSKRHQVTEMETADSGGCVFCVLAKAFVSYVCCVGSGLCDQLITRAEESYRVCMYNCVRSTRRYLNNETA
jgi:hypothetical protein